MHRGAILSGSLHVMILAVVIFGLPWWFAPDEFDRAIPVRVATLAELTAPPPQEAPPEPPQAAQPEPPPPPPPPLPEEPVAEEPPPEPEPVVEPELVPEPEPAPPQPVAMLEPAPLVEPEPLPEPLPVLAPEPEPEPEVPPMQEAVLEPPAKPKAVPVDKPKPPIKQEIEQPEQQPPVDSEFVSVLKNVEKLKAQAAPAAPEAPPAPNPPAEQSLSEQPLTMSEVDAIRRQIERCWNVPAGARDAQNLVVEIRVRLNPDGSVFQAEILDLARLASDGFFRAAAESAYRAVLQCSPLQLPPKKYNLWRVVTLRFNPREMFGT